MVLPDSQKSDHKQSGRSPLSSRLEKNLSGYALAASSAGVALLACSLPADAKIVSTKTNIVVPSSGQAQFDINNDGQFDFALSNVNFKFAPSTCTFTSQARQGRRKHSGSPPLGCGPFDFGLQVSPLQAGNEVWQAGTSYGEKCAADVRRGVLVGRGRPFAAGPLALSGLSGTSEGHPFCPWAFPHSPYLGVKFVDTEGKLHYGWVRVSVRQDYSTVIQAYAYETIPDKPIPAGIAKGNDVEESLVDPAGIAPQITEAATLGRLAQGASGLAAWRRVDENIPA